MVRTLTLIAFLFAGCFAFAQEDPYFVTYSQRMEEPGNLEVAVSSTVGLPHGGRGFAAPLLELEYGAKAWWTTEFYLEGQSRFGDGAAFTGWRWENRFKPLRREHMLNPVLYVEFENINEASRIEKEVVGHAEAFDESISELSREHARELETKLILSSNTHDWNISENFIVEKNLTEAEGFEFGYAFGLSRPLSRLASGNNCRFCRENFLAGLEVYGGLGDSNRFGFANTAQYLAPALAWQLGDDSAIRISPAFGVTSGSDRFLMRLTYSFEVRGFGHKLATALRGGM